VLRALLDAQFILPLVAINALLARRIILNEKKTLQRAIRRADVANLPDIGHAFDSE